MNFSSIQFCSSWFLNQENLEILKVILTCRTVTTALWIVPSKHRSIGQDRGKCASCGLYLLHIPQLMLNCKAVTAILWIAPGNHWPIGQDCSKSVAWIRSTFLSWSCTAEQSPPYNEEPQETTDWSAKIAANAWCEAECAARSWADRELRNSHHPPLDCPRQPLIDRLRSRQMRQLWPEFVPRSWADLELRNSHRHTLDGPTRRRIHQPGLQQMRHLWPEAAAHSSADLELRNSHHHNLAPPMHPLTHQPRSRQMHHCMWPEFVPRSWAAASHIHQIRSPPRHGHLRSTTAVRCSSSCTPAACKDSSGSVRTRPSTDSTVTSCRKPLLKAFLARSSKSPTLECSGSDRVSPEPLRNDTFIWSILKHWKKNKMEVPLTRQYYLWLSQ